MTGSSGMPNKVEESARRSHLHLEPFGIHLMIDGYLADPALTDADDHFHDILARLPDRLGMHRISDPLVVRVGPNNKKDPGGLSGFVMIAESHISFHSFPARGFISIDVYTCNHDTDLETVTAHLVRAFGIRDWDRQIVTRGDRFAALSLETLP